MFLERILEIKCACQYLNANEITSFSIEVKIDVQYRRLKSNGKIVVHVIQIALFLKIQIYLSINGIRHNQMESKSTPFD